MLDVIVRQNIGTIEWNYDELKANLADNLKKYNQVVTPETIKDAKSDMALLNKVDKAIADKDKEVKEQYCAPYLTFTKQAKELREMVKTARNQIDVQVKEFDEIEKNAKRNKIDNYFITLDFNLVDLNRIFDSRWLNKTCSDKQWQTELTAKVEQIKKDLAMIDLFGIMEDTEKNTIKAYYLQTLDLTLAKAKYDELQALKKKVEQPRFIDTGEVVIDDKPIAPEIERVDFAQEMEAERPAARKQRILVEFIAERPFFDAMNELVKRYKPIVKVREREDL